LGTEDIFVEQWHTGKRTRFPLGDYGIGRFSLGECLIRRYRYDTVEGVIVGANTVQERLGKFDRRYFPSLYRFAQL
jgi:hypothetical protein